MFHEKLARLVICSVIFCVLKESSAQGAHDLETKVSLLLRQEPENPKCFSESWLDLTCFWEDEETAGSPDQYTFTYKYLNENSNGCNVTSLPLVGGKRFYLCRLSRALVFVSLDVQVWRDGQLLHNRSLFMDLVFLLDPPAELTVSNTDQQGQLRVSWQPPLLKYVEGNMLYEVRYAPEGSHEGKFQVEEVLASSELVLRDLQPGTRYQVSVRVKLDGVSYNGYWSAWATPVFMETLPAVLDPLILSLSIIISVILTLLSLTVLLYYHRFLLKKVWPVIPTPDSKFQGLFTDYGGDFKEWLGQSNRGMWLTPAFFYSDELPAPVEVLSEVSLGPPIPTPHPKASAALVEGRDEEGGEEEEDKRLASEITEEAWRESKNDQWLIEQLRAFHQHPTHCSQSSLLESQDTYVTLNIRHPSGSTDEPLNDILEETLPLEVLFASGRSFSGSRSDLGSLQQSSGSGRLSSQSSFEYFNHTWPPKGPGYTYMGVADSGISMDYSPMSSSRIDFLGKGPEYKNQIPAAHRRAIVY